MHRITLIAVGKIKSLWISDGCEEFTERLRPHIDLTVREIPPSRQKDAAKQRDEESEQILHALQKERGDIYLFDETGKNMRSIDFASFISSAQDRGTPLTFLIGGAYGVNDAIRKIVRGSIRLSDMTLTHEMARLFFLEQLYRASEIKRGSGYHH